VALVVAAQTGVPEGWTTFTSAKGGYSAAFPAKPNEVGRTVSRGDSAVVMTVASVRRGPVTYSISSGELDEARGSREPARGRRDNSVAGHPGDASDDDAR
jgi:hypothetical protein